MNNKLHKRLILVFVALFIFSVIGLSATTARYVSAPPSSNDDLSGDLQYTVENQIEISSADQFFTAIANGYSNIKLSDDVQNPLLISGSGMNVWSDLTLDLNGHDIQRNSREPMLTVVPGVKMTVVDSSSQQNGSFYNPVGSVLAIDGGALTVMSGKFESGVRPSEYYSAHNATSYTGGVVDTGGSVVEYDVTSGSTTTKVFAPTLLPTVMVLGTDDKGNNKYIVNGNVYFDEAYQSNSTLIPADTYLYLVMEGASDTMVATGSADFHYSYTLYTNVVSGDFTDKPEYYLSEPSGTLGADYKALNVTIYGYRNVMSYAKNDTSAISNGNNTSGNMQDYLGREKSNFAAIKMRLGNLYSRGGDYTSHFGVDTAYCIYAAGGDMIVSGGNFATNKEGVCIQCAFGDGALDGSLTVSDGKFASEKGNTIQVKSGQMTVTGGTFVKDASADVYSTASTAKGENGASIYVQSGQLDINGESEVNPISFELYGSGVCGIAMASANASGESEDAVLNINNATFVFNEANSGNLTQEDFHDNAGIYNSGGVIHASHLLFEIPDTDSIGIDLPASTQGASADKTTIYSSIFVMNETGARGINLEAGTLHIGAEDCSKDSACVFYIDQVEDCYGVFTQDVSGSIVNLYVNVAQFIMGQTSEVDAYNGDYLANAPGAYTGASDQVFKGAGIHLEISDTDVFQIGRVLIISGGSYTAGVHSVTGNITQEIPQGKEYRLVLGMGMRANDYAGNGKNSNDNSAFVDERFGKEWFYVTTATDRYVAMDHDQLFTRTASTDSSNTTGHDLFIAKTNLPTTRFDTMTQTNAVGSYGIFSSGGTINARNLFIAQSSNYGSAIYSQGGTINIANLNCDVITLANSNYQSPYATGVNIDGKTAITTDAITVKDGTINIQNSTINTDAIGVKVINGSVNFGHFALQGSSENYGGVDSLNYLRSTRATAIWVTNGNFNVKQNSTFSLLSNIANRDNIVNHTAYSANDFTDVDGKVLKPHGIYVNGGSLVSNGSTFNMFFSGLPNNTNMDDFVSFATNSYAINVHGTSTANTIVYFRTSDIVSWIGGGINVDSDSDATTSTAVTMDTAKVYALQKGYNYTAGDWRYNSGWTKQNTDYFTELKDIYATRANSFTGSELSGLTGGWQFRLHKFGGSAVMVSNGDLTINGGEYFSAQGNGVYVNGANSNVVINDGTFTGVDSYALYDGAIISTAVGPAASAGLKLISGTLTVNGGTYSGRWNSAYNVYQGNGAIIMGTSAPDNGNYACTANLNQGTIVTNVGRGMQLLGYCQVNFGSQSTTKTEPFQVTGNIYAIGLENFGNNSSYDWQSELNIYRVSITTAQHGNKDVFGDEWAYNSIYLGNGGSQSKYLNLRAVGGNTAVLYTKSSTTQLTCSTFNSDNNNKKSYFEVGQGTVVVQQLVDAQ